MKISIAFLLAWVATKSFADQILVTNWIQPTVYFRIVDGQVYNSRYSTNWATVYSFLNAEEGGTVGTIKVNSMSQDSAICDVTALDMTFEKKIIVLNVPPAVTVGDYLKPTLLVMKVAPMGRLETFDCGTQATNPIPYIHYITVKKNPS